MFTGDLSYDDQGVSLRGSLTCDETVAGRRPGVLVLHEGLGLNAHAMERADRLARLGYVALAHDMFGDRRQAGSLEEARALMGPLAAQPAKLRARGRAGLAVLAALPQVDPERLAAIGFCFGGSVALELAREGAKLAAVVSLHGTLASKAPAVAGNVRARILVLTGADDPLVPAAQVIAFEQEMRAARVEDWQLISYGNTLHGFTNPAADGSILPSARYHPRSDRRAWTAMGQLLAEAFAAQSAAD
jgi:dienelactone hydrolase